MFSMCENILIFCVRRLGWLDTYASVKYSCFTFYHMPINFYCLLHFDVGMPGMINKYFLNCYK